MGGVFYSIDLLVNIDQTFKSCTGPWFLTLLGWTKLLLGNCMSQLNSPWNRIYLGLDG